MVWKKGKPHQSFLVNGDLRASNSLFLLFSRIACFLSLWIDVERQELVADKLLRGAMKRTISHVVMDPTKKEHILHKLSTGHRINPLASMAVKPVPVNKQLLDWDSRKIARHLTMSEWGLFSKVRHTEFIGMAWQKPDKSVRAPYLTKLNERFNQVCERPFQQKQICPPKSNF